MTLSDYPVRPSIGVTDIERSAVFYGFGQDDRGIGPRAGGGRIAWVEDPDGNTLAIETDD
ncbi:MAG: hypothetical protein K0Q52_529 [Microbacterium sp.]|jgi:hypothetical protein|nr:hypothetical protein [Microbacterium sp.]